MTVGCRQEGLQLILDRWLKSLRLLRPLPLDFFGRPIPRTDHLRSLLGVGWIARHFPLRIIFLVLLIFGRVLALLAGFRLPLFCESSESSPSPDELDFLRFSRLLFIIL